MFLSSRVVPETPPSLVKFSSRDRVVMIGASTSAPSRDQVPELRKARRGPTATDATADPVSWQAGATTGVPANDELTSFFKWPRRGPDSTRGGSRRGGASGD